MAESGMNLTSSNMQMTIITLLENANSASSDEHTYVPQSVLWEKILNLEGTTSLDDNEKDHRYQCFLSALVGKKNSFALFESKEDPETGEISWRIRPQTPESAALYLTKGDKTKPKNDDKTEQIQSLRKTLIGLKNQATKLDYDNMQYSMMIDRIKRASPPNVQKNFESFEKLYQIIEQSNHSIHEIEKQVMNINQKIEALI